MSAHHYYNQGPTPSCTQHAVARILVDELQKGYQVTLDQSVVVSVLKSICYRQSYQASDVIESWNKSGSKMWNSAGTEWYDVKIKYFEVSSFKDAMKYIQENNGGICIHVKTPQGENHLVAAEKWDDELKAIKCINSHGDKDKDLYIADPEKKPIMQPDWPFFKAWRICPQIQGAKSYEKMEQVPKKALKNVPKYMRNNLPDDLPDSFGPEYLHSLDQPHPGTEACTVSGRPKAGLYSVTSWEGLNCRSSQGRKTGSVARGKSFQVLEVKSGSEMDPNFEQFGMGRFWGKTGVSKPEWIALTDKNGRMDDNVRLLD